MVSLKNITDVIESPNKNKTEINTKDQIISPKLLQITVRGIWYFLSLVMLLLVTILIFFALFTNNWRQSKQESGNSNQIYSEYYTYGIWNSCRHIKIVWLSITDIYCSQIKDDLGLIFYLKKRFKSKHNLTFN